jgi:XTP/dITP diphosphohydrolase
MVELLVATKNKGKLKEIRELLADLPVKVTSLVDYDGLPTIVEDGPTFRQNAVKKALVISRHLGKLTLGEDSGLEVAALGNRPGVYSARYAGEGASDEANNRKLIRALRGLSAEKRSARYRCLAALSDGEKLVGVVSGTCRGQIATAAKGTNGFGYDPLFVVPRYQKTFGELDPAIKAKISHRARALKKLKKLLSEYLTTAFSK